MRLVHTSLGNCEVTRICGICTSLIRHYFAFISCCNVKKNSTEQRFAVHIVQCCQQYCSALLKARRHLLSDVILCHRFCRITSRIEPCCKTSLLLHKYDKLEKVREQRINNSHYFKDQMLKNMNNSIRAY